MTGKFHGKRCPMCGAGTLSDGERTRTIARGEHIFVSTNRGAYCDKCDDGLTYHDEAEERRWEEFLDKTGGRYQRHVIT